MARRIAAVVFSLGCIQASPVMALGLGEMTLDSYLNEPLRAEVDLLNTGGLHEDQIKIRLATTDDFKRMGVDRAYFLTSISFVVEIDDSGRARIVITSEDPVLEPYLDFVVEARWPSGRLLREYTVLVDPPVFDQSNTVISASSRVAQIEGEPDPAKKKQIGTSNPETRIDVRDSQLAQGDMPARDFNASTSPAALPGTRYMIHRDDTLWQIASQARPGAASVHQTMLEIQRLNPDAFIGGNINLIKAGYIIYLPDEGDISIADQSLAEVEVRQQNEAWREDKLSEPGYGSGPSLRISAATEEESGDVAATQSETAATAAAMETAEKAELERVEMQQRLESMEQQLETLQRIVSLKDDQIAALQGVLADQQADVDTGLAQADAEELAALEGEAEEMVDAAGETSVEADEAVVETEAAAAAPEPAKAAPAAPVVDTPGADDSPGFFGNLWLVLVAAVLGVAGIIYMRRRRQEPDEDMFETETAPESDVFADVELTEQELDVEEAVVPTPAEEPPEPAPEAVTDSRGYGEHKHDEYASDEASDALAEAEIYIAYGRYPQAIDLLKNALGNDPDNVSYRLKLVQLYVETDNRTSALQELAELELIGDEAAIAAARAALEGGGEKPAQGEDPVLESAEADTDLLAELDEPLESDFSDLEIEEPEAPALELELEDELDLSADFENAGLTGSPLGEELVIATESDGLSTKLDLARAYMDMGDDDGARQILEEVATEGSGEIEAEARALLDRLA